jgi:hypothetical protein
MKGRIFYKLFLGFFIASTLLAFSILLFASIVLTLSTLLSILFPRSLMRPYFLNEAGAARPR